MPELADRLRRTLLAWRWRRRLALGLPPPRPAHIDAVAPQPFRLPEIHSTLSEADIKALLGGLVATLETDPAAIRAFEAGQRNRFFSRIPPPRGPLDIRAVWEPARLQHFIAILAHLRHQPADPERKTIQVFVRDGLARWVRDNRFLHGPHYMSPMECGLRIPVFMLALGTVDDWPAKARHRIVRTVYEHAWWLHRNLSLHSSLGNHTVCECVGLVFAGALFRGTREGRRWLDWGYTLLGEELPHQILEDGGPAEQSVGYLRFVVDLYWLAAGFLESNRLKPTDEWKPRLTAAEGFLSAFSHSGTLWPDIGDNDNGHAVAPGLSPQRPPDPPPFAGIAHFPTSGYTLVRTEDDTAIVFDHGPLGMSPLYNHGHADALAVHLKVRGRPILVDPGTYRYNGAPQWRRYFKSTRAHNTVAIDGQDQAVQASGFVWSHPYVCRMDRYENRQDHLIVSASHDGYRHLDEPVDHRRTVFWNQKDTLVIDDTFQGTGHHRFDLHFHLHPQAAVEPAQDRWLIRNDGATVHVHLELSGEGGLEAVRGWTNPPLGWFSPAYGIKEPCTVLTATRTGRPKDVRFRTLIRWE